MTKSLAAPAQVVDKEVDAAVDGKEEVGDQGQHRAPSHLLPREIKLRRVLIVVVIIARGRFSLYSRSTYLTLGSFPKSSKMLGTVFSVWQMTKMRTMRRLILNKRNENL